MTFLSSRAVLSKICVLNLNSPEDKVYKFTKRFYQFAPDVEIFHSPGLQQVRKCFEEDYEKVVWISHATINSQQNVIPLFYHPSKNRNVPILKRYFELLKEAPLSTELKEFHLALCGVKTLKEGRSSLDPLLDELERFNIKVFKIRPSKFYSRVLRKDVSKLSLEWLSSTMGDKKYEYKVWKTNKNNLCKRDYWPGCHRSGAKFVMPLDPSERLFNIPNVFH